MRSLPYVALLSVLLLGACGGGNGGDSELEAGGSQLAFVSGDVANGEPIDVRHTCDGDDASPGLAWTGLPEGTRELALVVDDPDADAFTHWLVYGLRPEVTRIPPRVSPVAQVPGPTPLLQGVNDFGNLGYGGPCPPEGETHTYVFRLLALDAALGLAPGADREAFEADAEGHVLAEAVIEAPYTRSG